MVVAKISALDKPQNRINMRKKKLIELKEDKAKVIYICMIEAKKPKSPPNCPPKFAPLRILSIKKLSACKQKEFPRIS